MNLKLNDKVSIKTDWADDEFPDCAGVVIGFRHGGGLVIVETNTGRSPRYLAVKYVTN